MIEISLVFLFSAKQEDFYKYYIRVKRCVMTYVHSLYFRLYNMYIVTENRSHNLGVQKLEDRS